jgi:hypothetical protein
MIAIKLHNNDSYGISERSQKQVNSAPAESGISERDLQERNGGSTP